MIIILEPKGTSSVIFVFISGTVLHEEYRNVNKWFVSFFIIILINSVIF